MRITAIAHDLTHIRYVGNTTDRWAEVTFRETHDRRPTSFIIVLSSGTRIGGELPPGWVDRRVCRWIMEGV